MGHSRVQTTQPGDISVRRARKDERKQIHAVFYSSIHEGTGAFYNESQRAAWAPDTNPVSKDFDAEDNRKFWLAEVNGQIVGFMAVTPDGYLDLAFVLPEWMGRGVAQAVYDQLLEWAHDTGLKRLTTHASHFARRFFAKQGWQVDTPEIHTHNGQEFERFQMSLELEKHNEETIQPRR